MTTVYQNKSVTHIFFTDADYGTEYDGENSVALITAGINTAITTTDPHVQVSTVDRLVQPTPEANGAVTVITTILTSDANIVIETTSNVTSSEATVVTTGSEDIDPASGLHRTIITSVASKTGVQLDLYAASVVTLPASTTVVEPDYRYLLLRHDLIDGYLHGNPGGDFNMTCQEMYSLMNFSCVKLSEGLYQTLVPSWSKEKIIEIDANTAFFGSTFFSEIRPIAKVWEAKTVWYGEKVPTEITPEIVQYILTMMKGFATEIISAEYERRYLALRGASDFEADTWHIQREEATDYSIDQSVQTPFIDTLVALRGINKDVLVGKILDNARAYNIAVATKLAEMQELLAKFNSCTTVWDINILYEDYFGIAMPISMAIKLGRTVSAEDWNRKPEWRVKGNGCYF
jgi:hypothetical protein